MSSDELIDDVAKDMTAMATRPALRERVMASIADAPQGPQYGWWVPAMAAAAGVAIATWLLVPARLADDGAASTTARHDVAVERPRVLTPGRVSGPISDAVMPAPVQVARNTTTTSSTRRATLTTPAAVSTVWPDTLVAEIPMLPPLAGPPPIVIEPIAWDEVMIVPLNVALIEVKALAIEPLDVSDLSGV